MLLFCLCVCVPATEWIWTWCSVLSHIPDATVSSCLSQPYIYIYVCVCVCLYVFFGVSERACMCARTCVHVCAHACTCACMCARMSACMHACLTLLKQLCLHDTASSAGFMYLCVQLSATKWLYMDLVQYKSPRTTSLAFSICSAVIMAPSLSSWPFRARALSLVISMRICARQQAQKSIGS